MRKVSIDSLVGGEELAKEVCTVSGLTLIPAGAIIKKDYIEKMKELKINGVYIKPRKIQHSSDVIKEDKIQKECKYMVKQTIEKYSYCANEQLQKIVTVADQIMRDILSEPEVMYNLAIVRDKDESTYSHSINVTALSVLVGLNMKLAKNRVRDLAIGALLHDLGMVYLSFDYRNIVLDQCNDEKKKEIINHVITGYSMVETQDWLSNLAKDIILSHHERDDGSGYPMRLTKDKIRIETKIVALCDEFDSRVYGNLMAKQKVHHAVDYILSEAGRKFDFNVVQTFIESVAVYPVGTHVRTNQNEIGVVIHQNYKMPMRPVIKITSGNIEQPVIRDLVKELTIFIIESL
jgi:HD-GYP domain-containing protein (c-di-GMP phosphodiesterase class II)